MVDEGRIGMFAIVLVALTIFTGSYIIGLIGLVIGVCWIYLTNRE